MNVNVTLADPKLGILLRDVISRLARIERLIIKEGEQMTIDYASFIDSQTKEADAEVAVAKLLTTLTEEIKEISASSSDPDTQAKLDKFTADTIARTQALVAATLANTPAVTPPAPPAPTE